MIKRTIFFLIFFMSVSLYSQTDAFRSYQYLIVADKFEFLNDSDKYQTSSLTKFLFQKKKFKVFLSNEKLPDVLNANRCLALFVSVKDESSMFSIKNLIEIKDCSAKVVYTSKIGKSKFKDYKKGYQEAIRNAFDSMEDFEFGYKPVETSSLEKDTSGDEVIREELLSSIPLVTDVVTIPEIKNQEKIDTKDSVVLYAQAIENGFQLVNIKPEVVFIILKTNKKDVFILQGKNGNFYKKGDHWLAEYYEGTKLEKKEFKVKF